MHIAVNEGLFRIGLQGWKIQVGHVVQYRMLWVGGVVDELAAHHPGIEFLPGVGKESHVTIDLVLPFKFVAIGKIVQTGRGFPGVVTGLPLCVRDCDTVAVITRENAQVETDAFCSVGNMRDAVVLLAVGSPGREA
ncbi:MAG: hypothetical protein CVU40_16190 [Chloroflexi bacterium HGW-Chloroflexi-2]|nr:MAG: hypothetical protein CVU40_16190 [Chloroflexi bacterium HGW-Chloroflexi-2]